MSTIYLYKSSKITPQRNLKLDNIEAYLGQLETSVFAQFQYIRPKLETSVKINYSQSGAFASAYVFDYCKIKNDDNELTAYYYIVRSEQRSENTLELFLKMDTINTFNGKYSFSPLTSIKREMKDRWESSTERAIGEMGLSSPYYSISPWPTWAGVTTFRFKLKNSFATERPNAKSVTAYAVYADNEIEAVSVTYSEANKEFVCVFRIPINGGDPTDVRIVYSYDNGVKLFPIVDYLSEGIEPPLYKKSEEEIPQFLNQSWNLIYRADNPIVSTEFNQVNPVTTYLAGDLPIHTQYYQEGSNIKTATDFQSSRYTWIPSSLNGSIAIEYATGQDNYIYYDTLLAYTDSSVDYAFVIYSNGTEFTLEEYTVNYTQGKVRRRMIGKVRPQSIKIYSAGDILGIRTIEIPSTPPSFTNAEVVLTLTSGVVEADTLGVEQIDRTDARLMKIIKLPFPPIQGETRENNTTFNLCTYDSTEGLFKVLPNITFNYTFEAGIQSPLHKLNNSLSFLEIDNPHHIPFSIDYEPKLLHSDFYQPTFVYDSFTFPFELERVNGEEYRNANPVKAFNLQYCVTNTINSKFLFMFPDYILDMSQSNYDNVLPIARNNEVPIYSNQYVDYIKTGYNYDVKEKNRTIVTSLANLGVGLGSTIGTNLLPKVSNFASLYSATDFTHSFINSITNIQRAEEGLERKKKTLLNQSTSVQGSDDIDLLLAYSNNQCKVVYYEPSDEMKEAILHLFHYCGYTSVRKGLPRENTRHWFDFCQADVSFLDDAACPVWALDDIKERYANGVTILHERNGEYDINQEYENWEINL